MDPIVPRHTLDYILAQDRVKPALSLRLRQRFGPSKLESSAERAESGEDAEPTADSISIRSPAPSLHRSWSRSGKQARFAIAPDSGGGRPWSRRMSNDVKRSSSIGVSALQDVDHQQPRPSPKTSLLDLPRELRDMIYEWLYSDWSVRGAKSLALLRTCRQLRREASKIAFERALFRIHTEHWSSPEHFRARQLARIAPEARAAIRHLALRLPRGMPHDRCASASLDTDLAGLGFRLTTLVIFSHLPRPLPHTSVYGGVLEASLCAWLKQALYAMPSLKHVCILNYESATPALHDMPSPRLIRMLRGSIFEDVMADCETWSEQILQRAWPRRSGDADAQSKTLGSDAMTRMRSLGRRLSLSR